MLSTCLSQVDCQCEDSTTIEQKTDRKALVQLYEHLPFQYPSLFEELLLNYRWDELDLLHIPMKVAPSSGENGPVVTRVFMG